MDPDETLKWIDTFIKNHQTGDEVDVWTQNLAEWIDRGGFEPDWSRYELGASYYRTRRVSYDRGERV